MADSSRQKNSRRDIDISTHQSGPKFGLRGNVIVWGAFLTLFVLLYYFQLPLWLIFSLVPAVIVILVGILVWKIVIKRGILTWMRMVMKPAQLMAAGDAGGAEEACAKALARARSFATGDHRRGIMLCELAMFVKNQGRQTEAIELYEECVGIFATDALREPFDYFVSLNNYGICFIHVKDYDAAQRTLEKAIDMIMAARKREANQIMVMALAQVQALEFVLHLNLAFLFMEMHEMREAELQLRDADALAPLLSKKTFTQWNDHYRAICAAWEFHAGNLDEADQELAKATNAEFPTCLRMRARLCLARGQFAEAVKLLRKYQAAEKKKGTLHRPDLLKATLDYADALYGDCKHDEGLAAFVEARSIAADFKVPPDADWAKTLEQWLPRVRAAQPMELAELMASEIAQIKTSPNKAITILDKFKRHEDKA